MTLSPDKYPYKLAELYPKKPKVAARYYVKFAAWDIKANQLKSVVSWCPSACKTDKEVSIWAKEEIARINAVLVAGAVFGQSEPKIKEVPTIKNLFPELLENRKDTFRKRSYDTYKTALKKLIGFLDCKGLQSLKVSEFSNLYLSDFVDYLLKLGNCNSTVNNVLELIGWFFEQSVNKEVIDKKPYKLVRLKETDSSKNVAFTRSHQTIIEAYLLENNYPLYLFTRFIYHGFIRPKELKELKVSNLDFDRRLILVAGSISKNRKNETVPINQTLYKYARTFEGKTGYLFGKNLEIGTALSCQTNYPYNAHAAALVATGLDGLGYSLYSWKHTGAVRAYESGLDIKKLQRLLRHSSLTITDIYLRSLNVVNDIESLKGW